ncbi:GtrA family protein [uncultured Methanobrevibacter sp.]|uniref:GtrA family protein n=1 Tax=uncultured Methanobrevibacter sp. TaxID=253161 RepID=UPI0026195F72|nr:GtrA family protein [uncultured Methanobrevibacter sp.]
MKLSREIFWYVVFGILTTLVNIVVYFVFAHVLGVNYLISNVVAWFLSVLLAYVTNRRWVFESKSSNILKECGLFFGGRLFSGVVDTGLMWLFIDVLTLNDGISKIVIQVIVVVLNYVISKLVVFK